MLYDDNRSSGDTEEAQREEVLSEYLPLQGEERKKKEKKYGNSFHDETIYE